MAAKKSPPKYDPRDKFNSDASDLTVVKAPKPEEGAPASADRGKKNTKKP